jgi:hypothetical protein
LKEREDDAARSVKEKGRAVKDSLKAMLEKIVEREVQGIFRDPGLVNSKLKRANYYLHSGWEISGEAELAIEHAEESVQEIVEAVNGFFEKSWPEFRQAVEEAEVSFIKAYEPISVE